MLKYTVSAGEQVARARMIEDANEAAWNALITLVVELLRDVNDGLASGEVFEVVLSDETGQPIEWVALHSVDS